MGARYTLETGFQTLTGAQAYDLLEIPVPATCAIKIHSLQVDQSSDATSTEAERLQLFLKKGIGATSGSGGTGSLTPTKRSTGAPTCPITTAERNNTTQATAGGGSLTTLESWIWDVLAGFECTYTPELQQEFSPSEMIVLSVTAPADALTANAKIIFEVIGG